mmetsp:Transcript_126492/g.352441  ORF Transcript_126492/g.352441 Transcript_126492/m.352441 type:complete len:237 (+) Transcript_126492:1645-2355(+)
MATEAPAWAGLPSRLLLEGRRMLHLNTGPSSSLLSEASSCWRKSPCPSVLASWALTTGPSAVTLPAASTPGRSMTPFAAARAGTTAEVTAAVAALSWALVCPASREAAAAESPAATCAGGTAAPSAAGLVASAPCPLSTEAAGCAAASVPLAAVGSGATAAAMGAAVGSGAAAAPVGAVLGSGAKADAHSPLPPPMATTALSTDRPTACSASTWALLPSRAMPGWEYCHPPPPTCG